MNPSSRSSAAGKVLDKEFLGEALRGLGKNPKELPCKYLYDERGSRIFDRICELEEYYPTRTEAAIMSDCIDEMAAEIGPQAVIVEYGSGSCIKIRKILDNLDNPAGYVPIDISREHLLRSAGQLARDYPRVEIHPVVADYHADFEIPACGNGSGARVIYFPGSTIGNFSKREARLFLHRLYNQVHGKGGLLIGLDLKKDPDVLRRAYNDREGVTAEFNLNLLRRLNREAAGEFDLDAFRHEAVWNEEQGRVEMYLASLKDQDVRLDGQTIHFQNGERICTEYSCKYSLEEFADLAALAGFRVSRVWTDPRSYFSVQYLVAGQ